MDLGVAVPALNWVLTGVAIAAEDLDRPLRGPGRHPAGLHLGHRTFGVLERTLLSEPRRLPDEGAGGLHFGGHVSEHEGNALVLDNRATERVPFLGVLGRVLRGGTGNTERLRADGRSGRLEGLHRGLRIT